MSGYLNDYAPCTWSQSFWHTLHIISFAYPENPDMQLKQTMFNFFKNLGTMLPCKTCRDHYEKNFITLNLQDSLDSRTNLTLWVYNLHDLINKQTGSKESPPFDEVYQTYNTMRSDSCTEKKEQTCSSEDTGLKCVVKMIPKNKIENFPINDTSNYVILFLLIVIAFLVYKLLKKK